MDVRVKFLGASGSVTGSRYLLEVGDFKILFDCGLFQGLKELRLRNWDPFPVDVTSIDAVIISHAHIDHTGYLPRLVKEGYDGPVYCTRPTADLLELLLLDSAKLQEEEAAYAHAKGFSQHSNPQPLYTTQDAQRVFPLVKAYSLDEPVTLSNRIQLVFRNAGHLLGAAISEIVIQGDQQTKTLVFSGDLGRNNDPLLKPPVQIKQADVLFIESTYGHKKNPAGDPAGDLARVVNDTFKRGGILLIPAFAVGRTQNLLFYLHQLMEENHIPDVPVYIDSPMATSATYLYYRHTGYHKAASVATGFARQLETNMLVFVKSGTHSKQLNELKSRAIIISSSGMMTGGRVLHHLYNRLRNENDTVLVAGYQAAGTRGRDLVDKKSSIRIFGEDVPVRCQVENMVSLSSHADHDELFEWMSAFTDKPKVTFTVHGENPGLALYAQEIRTRFGWNVIQPEYLENVYLFKGI